jgi:mitochondrial import inner membrane translocase subunit TIM44
MPPYYGILRRQLGTIIRPSNARKIALAIHRSTIYPPPFRISAATFHSSSCRNDELPKSPFQTFVDVLKEELRKNRELQDNVKQLQGDVDKLQDSEAMKRARAAYERARVRAQCCVHGK